MNDDLNPQINQKKHNNGLNVKKRIYDIQYKRMIVQKVRELELNVKYPAIMISESHGIDVRTVRKWLNDPNLFDNMIDANKKKLSKGRPVKSQEIESYAKEWMEERRMQSLAVTGPLMETHLRQVFKDELQDVSHTNLLNQCYRMFDRNGFSSRQRTGHETILSEAEMGSIHLDFVMDIRETMNFFGVSQPLMINMDETPVYFDPEINSTFAPKGSKRILLKKTTTTSKCSVLLACSVNGLKLKPYIVFVATSLKGKVWKEAETYDNRNLYGVGPKGFSDTRIMVDWIERCLGPFIVDNGGGPESGQITLLMMDNYKSHLTKGTRDALAKVGCLLVPLPPNMTSKVQILDVGVNKPFKNHYKDQMLKWQLNNSGITSVSRCMCANWVAEAWENVKESSIVNTSKSIGFID